MILGKNLILAIGNTPLAASKSCRVSKSKSFIEVASPTASAWESFIPSKKGWSMSADCLIGTMEAYKTLDAAWKNDTALTIRFYNTEYDENETGTAYIENLELTASNGSLATMSVSLKGSGELSEYGEVMTISRTLEQTSRFYYHTTGNMYKVAPYSNTANIYSGSFTLLKRTLVQISYVGTGQNNLVFLSKTDGIVTKAQNEETIYTSNNIPVVKDSGRVWLDAGTWYIVESSQTYATPTYTKVS